jgi:hypothetical protein
MIPGSLNRDAIFGKSAAKCLYEFALIVVALLTTIIPLAAERFIPGPAWHAPAVAGRVEPSQNPSLAREFCDTILKDKTSATRRNCLDRTSTGGDQDANGLHHSRRLADYRFSGPDGDSFRASPARRTRS